MGEGKTGWFGLVRVMSLRQKALDAFVDRRVEVEFANGRSGHLFLVQEYICVSWCWFFRRTTQEKARTDNIVCTCVYASRFRDGP